MSNGRLGRNKGSKGRLEGGFVAMPWQVLDSASYALLSHPGRALLMELARQYVRDNNGRLLASSAYLSKRGWKSSDVITRAKRELLNAGFIHQTVQGHRPNKASWYAITWQTLDRIPGYDHGAFETFKRAAFLDNEPLKNTKLRPPHGVESAAIAPSRGVEPSLIAPSRGAISLFFDDPPTPSHGNHLDMPSPEAINA